MSFLASRLSRRLLLAVVLAGFVTAIPAPAINSGASFDIFSRRNVISSLIRRAGSSALSNLQDMAYFTNVTLGGVEIEVLIDTGSSDLWTIVPIPGAINLSIPVELNYVVGTTEGFIHTAELELGSYHIPDQAFIQASNVSDDLQGLIGLGPRYNSKIRVLTNSSAGTTPLDRIFQQDLSAPNILTVLMTRTADDAAGADPLDVKGQITIGKVVEGFEKILDTPKAPTLTDPYGRPFWSSYLEDGSIIGPDGQPIHFSSKVLNTTEPSRLRVVYDTGYSLPQLPPEVIDAIYGRVPGATFVKNDDLAANGGTPGYWRIPCDYELTITFLFGGVEIPIAPLDMSVPEDESGVGGMCIALFQTASEDFPARQQIDAILGMAFLRNAYFLVNYGDFVEGNPHKAADPYLQFLSITNMSDAHNDFVKIRRGGDFNYTQPPLLPVGQSQTTPMIEIPTHLVYDS